MFSRSLIFETVLMCLVAGSVSAQVTYHVDSRTGDDGASGLTPDRAWKSLERASAALLGPGDRLLFACGSSYSGMLKPQGSGSAEQPVEIGVYGDGPRPVINGEGAVEQALHLYNMAHVEVSGLELTNRGTGGSFERRGVYVEAIDSGEVQHIVLRDLFIHDVNGYTKQKGCTGGIRWLHGGSKVKTRFDDLRIEDCRIVRCDRDGIRGGSHYIQRDNRYLSTLIQYNEVYGMHGYCDGQGFDADFNSRHTTIQYNYSHDNEGGFVLVCTTAPRQALWAKRGNRRHLENSDTWNLPPGRDANSADCGTAGGEVTAFQALASSELGIVDAEVICPLPGRHIGAGESRLVAVGGLIRCRRNSLCPSLET